MTTKTPTPGGGAGHGTASTLRTEREGSRDTPPFPPEGGVLVPREPTEAMIEAGVDFNPTAWTEDTDRGFPQDVARSIWAAMLSAAPPISPRGVEIARHHVERLIPKLTELHNEAWTDVGAWHQEGGAGQAPDKPLGEALAALLDALADWDPVDELWHPKPALSLPTGSGEGLEEGWRTIDSAPKDGTPVLIAQAATGSIRWAVWSEGFWRDGQKRAGGQIVGCPSPTHWRPQPAPPALSSEAGS